MIPQTRLESFEVEACIWLDLEEGDSRVIEQDIEEGEVDRGGSDVVDTSSVDDVALC